MTRSTKARFGQAGDEVGQVKDQVGQGQGQELDNMEIFENSSRNFGADLLFSVRAMGQIYFQFEE